MFLKSVVVTRSEVVDLEYSMLATINFFYETTKYFYFFCNSISKYYQQ